MWCLINAANCIIDASKLLNQYNMATNQKAINGEDTFVQHFLSPWINNIFHGSSFGRRWANSLLASSSPIQHYPDFLLYTLFNDVRYDLFVVEVKLPGPTQCISDQRKLDYEMQKMLNVLVAAHIPSPVVCGVWVDGFTCYTYKMDLEFDGLYRFVELNCFELPHTIDDIAKAKYTFAAFMELKIKMIIHIFYF